jgi:hypothetical protein
MIRLKDLLNEAKQVGDIYHFTPLSNLSQILKSQYMIPNDENQVSATRWADMSISGFQDMLSKPVVRFMFDGNKISNNYQLRPYSYGDGSSSTGLSHDDFEKLGEEQIVVNGRNFYFMPYLKRIDIFVQRGNPDLTKSISILDKMNITYSIYQGTPSNNIPYTQSKEGDPNQITYNAVPKEILISTKQLHHPYPNYKTYKFNNNIQTYPLPDQKRYITKHPLIFDRVWDITPKYPNFYVKYSTEWDYNYEINTRNDFEESNFNTNTNTYNLGQDYRNQITQLILNSIEFKTWSELSLESEIEKLRASLNPYIPSVVRDSKDAGLLFLPKQIVDKYLIPYTAQPVHYEKWITPKKTTKPKYDFTGIDTPGDPTM